MLYLIPEAERDPQRSAAVTGNFPRELSIFAEFEICESQIGPHWACHKEACVGNNNRQDPRGNRVEGAAEMQKLPEVSVARLQLPLRKGLRDVNVISEHVIFVCNRQENAKTTMSQLLPCLSLSCQLSARTLLMMLVDTHRAESYPVSPILVTCCIASQSNADFFKIISVSALCSAPIFSYPFKVVTSVVKGSMVFIGLAAPSPFVVE